ncbi:MAG: cation diffusion facilitator family transporter [Candidatus Omnitrophota bacterium]|jgi:cation diffusion facilitator family transporter
MNKQCRELEILRFATGLTIAYAVVGVIIAILCDSITLMLDGLYGVADVVVSLISIFVVRKIHEPPNSKYHYGYAKYEPFMTAVDGILIITICAGTILSSIQDFVNPEPMANVSLAVIYSFASFFICCGFGLFVKANARKCSSELLCAEADLWMIEGWISLGVFVAFAISDFMTKTYWRHYSNLIDPLLSLLFSVALLARPLSLLKDSFLDLVDANPGKEIETEVRHLAGAYEEKFRLPGIDFVKLRKAGRRLFIALEFRVRPDMQQSEIQAVMDGLRGDLCRYKPEADVFVSFRF